MVKVENLLIASVAAILLFTVSETNGQKLAGKQRSTGSTSAATQKTSIKAAPLKPSSQTPANKITGWAVEVRSFTATVFHPYVGFNNTGLSVVILPVPAFAVNAFTSGTTCKFDISAKLLTEAQGIVGRLQPQKWNATYGDDFRRAFRVIITFHHSSGPSSVYETIWKATSDMPADLRQILILKDKVIEDNTNQCRNAMQ